MSNYAISVVLSRVQDGKERVIMSGSKGLVASQKGSVLLVDSILCDHPIFILPTRETLLTDHLSLRWLKCFHDKATDMLA